MMDLSKHKLLNVLLAYALVTHSARAWSFHQKTSTPKSSSSSSHTRGQLFLDALSITGGGLGLLLLNPQKSLAEGRREDAKEAIAKVASKVPGYGQPDVFYPSFFEGEWKMTREAIGLSAPQGEDKADPNDLAQAKALSNEKKLEYTVRYVRFPNSNGEPSEHVVADRGYNEASKEKARIPASKSDLYRDAVTPRWNPSNPNILTITFPDGLVREIKVTKRSFENPSDDAFGLTEFCRIADAQQESGIGASVPRISAVRILQRFKLAGPSKDVIEGLELVKYYPTVSLSTDPPAVLILKSRLKLERIG